MNSIVQAIIENSAAYPAKTALIYGETKISYSELTNKIYLFANSLKEKRLKKEVGLSLRLII